MKKDNSVPEETYPSDSYNRNGVGGHAPSSVVSPSHEIPSFGPAQNGPQLRYLDHEEEEGIDPRQILALLARRWKIIAATFFTILFIGVLSTLLAQPIYEAKAKLLVSSGGADARVDDFAFLDSMMGGQTRKIETEIEILKSDPIQSGALARLDAEAQHALERFKKINVTPVRNTDIVEVSGQSRKPEAASDLALAVCKEYIDQSAELSRAQVGSATEYVKEQLEGVREKLDAARTALKNYKERNDLVELTAQAQARITELSNVEAELRTAQTERQASAAQADRLRSMAAGMPSTQESNRVIGPSPAIQAMQSQLTKLELDLATARQEYTAESPEVRGLEREIEAVRQRMSNVARTEVSSRTQNPNPIRQGVLQELAQTQAQTWALDARTKALDAAQQRARAALADLPEQEYNLSRLVSDVEAKELTERMLNEKYQELSIQREANISTARIIEEPERAVQVSPRRVRNFILSTLLGLMAALALAALIDRMDDRIHSDEDAENFSRLPILAHIPLIKKSDEQLLINQQDQTSPLLESFRMLRANIAFSSLDKPLHTIAVTSSQPGEGKSTSATNLATVMALSGKRIILVDADLRRPNVHRLLNLPNQSGMSNVVSGQTTLEDALQDTSLPGLRVLTSGPTPPNPFELLESQAARNCLGRLREQADFVIVDTPPTLAVADAQIVASYVDGVVVVISAEEVGKREVARMREVLTQTGAKLLGSIFNKVPVGGLQGYYNGYSYSYHPEYQQSGDSGKSSKPSQAESNKSDFQETTRL